MDPSLNPPPEPPYLTGSRLGDRVLGILVGVLWWPLGFFAGALSGILLLGVLALFIWHLVYLGRRKGGHTLMVTSVITAVVTPVLLFLGVFGMCALKA